MEQGPASIEKFSLVRQHRRMLANMNCYLTKESRILDFGCGSGSFVYQYRDAGFDAYGFDIRPSVAYRAPKDEQFFGFAMTGKPANVPEYEVNLSSFRIPFEEGFFDFVYSTSTLEHVQDHELAVAERKLRVGTPLIIGELYLEDPGSKDFDDSADLAADQASLGQVGGERDDAE